MLIESSSGRISAICKYTHDDLEEEYVEGEEEEEEEKGGRREGRKRRRRTKDLVSYSLEM